MVVWRPFYQALPREYDRAAHDNSAAMICPSLVYSASNFSRATLLANDVRGYGTYAHPVDQLRTGLQLPYFSEQIHHDVFSALCRQAYRPMLHFSRSEAETANWSRIVTFGFNQAS